MVGWLSWTLGDDAKGEEEEEEEGEMKTTTRVSRVSRHLDIWVFEFHSVDQDHPGKHTKIPGFWPFHTWRKTH